LLLATVTALIHITDLADLYYGSCWSVSRILPICIT